MAFSYHDGAVEIRAGLDRSRILVAMFSVLMNVPFMYVIYMGVPWLKETVLHS